MKYLIIGGGAMGYYSILGQLEKLKEQGKLDDLEEMSGASTGTLILYMYAMCKGNIKEILDKSLDIDIIRCTKPNLLSIISKFGFIRTRSIKNELKKIAYKKLNIKSPTFREIAEFSNIHIHIPAFCVSTGITEYFSDYTHPDTKILDIICASIAVPLLFSAQKINKKLYVDGALEEKIPALPFLGKNWNEIYAIELLTEQSVEKIEIKDIRTFVETLANIGLKNRIEYPGIKKSLLYLPAKVTFDFKMKTIDKLALYIKGYSSTS